MTNSLTGGAAVNPPATLTAAGRGACTSGLVKVVVAVEQGARLHHNFAEDQRPPRCPLHLAGLGQGVANRCRSLGRIAKSVRQKQDQDNARS